MQTGLNDNISLSAIFAEELMDLRIDSNLHETQFTKISVAGTICASHQGRCLSYTDTLTVAIVRVSLRSGVIRSDTCGY